MLVKKSFKKYIHLITSTSLIKYQSSKQPNRKYRDKFQLDYEYFTNIPINQRED